MELYIIGVIINNLKVYLELVVVLLKWLIGQNYYGESRGGIELEEDIEILENYIREWNDTDVEQALQNLIARYKELEDKNKTLETLLQGNLYQMYLYYKELAGRYQANSISKDKVKEKIEELDKRIDFLNTELTKCYIEREKLGTETDIDNNETYIFYMEEEKNFREKQKEILQELLGEE